ncbi:arsenate reductase ArsC [Sinimarinibacterium sp. NLF-5-8]|uniref:arsenate reductase ArsC n=1 Tax=Sinimarinibacterium sp. NLF-5-8 TaxID=2698684 RepID=UPI00137BA712|nr:arsenate reductase ArsC [Sinimarinibacterium sp. NLF-5-8]QHS08733.1 arsenate reductase ArsC [Sinimarinibacterium sp. NLF-5-8]
MTKKTYRILVLCTGNSARSIMAEALINTLGQGRFRAYSAGSHPAGQVHPLAIEQLQTLAYPVETLRSKSWDEFTKADAPELDWVITVCDAAAGQICPIWPNRPATAHWGFEDPASVQGDDAQRRQAFSEVFARIRNCVQQLVDLPVETLESATLIDALRRIGTTSGQA